MTNLETCIETEAMREFVEDHKQYIMFNSSDDDFKETLQGIIDNDGRCTCTAGVGPKCPCAYAMKVVHGELMECHCGLFVARVDE